MFLGHREHNSMPKARETVEALIEIGKTRTRARENGRGTPRPVLYWPSDHSTHSRPSSPFMSYCRRHSRRFLCISFSHLFNLASTFMHTFRIPIFWNDSSSSINTEEFSQSLFVFEEVVYVISIRFIVLFSCNASGQMWNAVDKVST